MLGHYLVSDHHFSRGSDGPDAGPAGACPYPRQFSIPCPVWSSASASPPRFANRVHVHRSVPFQPVPKLASSSSLPPLRWPPPASPAS